MSVSDELAKEIEEAVDVAAKEAEERHEVERRLTNEEIVENETNEQAREEVAESQEAEASAEASQSEENEGQNQGDDQEAHGDVDPGPIVPVVIPDDAIEAAVIAGIPIADARTFASEDQLRRVTAALDAANTQEELQETEKQQTLLDRLDTLPELDAEEFKPEVIEIFNGLKQAIAEQQETIDSFRSIQSDAVEAAQAANGREIIAWFDQQVNDLGEDFTDALGEGPITSLPQGSSQAAKRDQIATQMTVMMNGYKASGLPEPPREQLFDSAARIVLKDEFSKVGHGAIQKQLEQRSSQHIQPAGSTNQHQDLSPMDETARLIDEKFFS
jgi:hypothetical protein